MEKSVTVRIPAKLNITLDVVGRRQDGYHFLKSIMQAVSLYDELDLRLIDGQDVVIKCDYPGVPCDERNLAAKAVFEFLSYTKRPPQGVEIRILKKIPIESGLAGGSADAAGVLVGLNYLLRADLKVEQLCEIGLEIGADVPFCVLGGTAMVEGIGEQLLPLPTLPDCYFVIARGEEGISTADAFQRFDQFSDPNCVVAAECDSHSTDDCVAAIAAGSLDGVALACHNDMENAVKFISINKFKSIMMENDALCASMTGSGSAVFGIFEKKRLAMAACDALKAGANPQFAVVCAPVENGAEIV